MLFLIYKMKDNAKETLINLMSESCCNEINE